MENIGSSIIELLSDKKARDSIEIIEYLNLGDINTELILSTLDKMTKDYMLYCTKKNKYMLFKDSELSKNFVRGKFIDTNNDYGFVEVDEMNEDIFIHGSNTFKAVDGDIVLVEIIKRSSNDKKCEGRIVKIIKRDLKQKVGEVYHYDNKLMVSLDSKKYKKLIMLKGDKEDLDRLVDGDKIICEFIEENREIKREKTKKSNLPEFVKAKFIKRIGHINDPDIDILSIIADCGFDVDFPDEVLEELKEIPTEVRECDKKNRIDLTDKVIFTIDGDDTKDIDDAISVEKLNNGHYKLGVHIADVSYYIKEGTALDLEARNRGTSVYLTDRVIPMIPHQLSNGICSLNPNVERLATSCEMEINEKGSVINAKIFESIIKSRIQMTYKKVNAYLEEGIVNSGYEEYTKDLDLMYELSKLVRQNKINRGFIDFDTDEIKIKVDENGVPTEILKRTQGVGESLIEDFMILANESVAEHLFYMELPSVYRVHGEPSIERLRKLLGVLSNMGISIKDDLNKVTPKTIQKIINELKEDYRFKVLSVLMLSCMDKAIYDTKNIGHFGIASKCYTHFTSPIRRYPDTTIHRLLKRYLFEKDGVTDEKIRHFEEILPDICMHSSERERASVECEREVDEMKEAEYMEKHIGEKLEGMVSSVTNFGLFVQLDNLIEGLIPNVELDDYYNYDQKTESLIASNSHKRFCLGDRVLVEVIRASKQDKKIDFRFIKRIDVNNEKEKNKERIA